jgi:hypothetical protein
MWAIQLSHPDQLGTLQSVPTSFEAYHLKLMHNVPGLLKKVCVLKLPPDTFGVKENWYNYLRVGTLVLS